MYTIAALYHFSRFDDPSAMKAPLDRPETVVAAGSRVRDGRESAAAAKGKHAEIMTDLNRWAILELLETGQGVTKALGTCL